MTHQLSVIHTDAPGAAGNAWPRTQKCKRWEEEHAYYTVHALPLQSMWQNRWFFIHESLIPPLCWLSFQYSALLLNCPWADHGSLLPGNFPNDYTSPLKINAPAFMTLGYPESCKDGTLPMFWEKGFLILSILLQGCAFGWTKNTNPFVGITICLLIIHLFYQVGDWIQVWIQVRQVFLCYPRPSDVHFPFQDTIL